MNATGTAALTYASYPSPSDELVEDAFLSLLFFDEQPSHHHPFPPASVLANPLKRCREEEDSEAALLSSATMEAALHKKPLGNKRVKRPQPVNVAAEASNEPPPLSPAGSVFSESDVNELQQEGTVENVAPRKAYPCPAEGCTKTYLTKEGLRLHHRNIHATEKPNRCALCPRSFVRSGDLKLHVLRIHCEERPFPCEKCYKTFASKGELDRHDKVHSAAKLKRGAASLQIEGREEEEGAVLEA